jgi:hypothetical protein
MVTNGCLLMMWDPCQQSLFAASNSPPHQALAAGCDSQCRTHSQCETAQQVTVQKETFKSRPWPAAGLSTRSRTGSTWQEHCVASEACGRDGS